MIVFTAGTFDLLHKGHLNLIEKCRLLAGEGGTLHVLVNGDVFVSNFKGKHPIQDQSTRLAVIKSLKNVDYAHLGESRSSLRRLIESIPSFYSWDRKLLVVGSDWANKEYFKQIDMNPEEVGATLIYVPYTEGVSSSEIRGRM